MALMKSKAQASDVMEPARKRAFAIAHSVKKRMGGRSQSNEMLNPEKSGGTEVRDQIYQDQRLSKAQQAHGQTPQPQQPGASYRASRGVDPNIRPEPRRGQVELSPSDQAAHFAEGGMTTLSRRERALKAMENAGQSEEMSQEEKPSAVNPESPDQDDPFAMAAYHQRKADHFAKMAEGGFVGTKPLTESKVGDTPPREEREKAPETGAGALNAGFSKVGEKISQKVKGYDDGGMIEDDQGGMFGKPSSRMGSSIASAIRGQKMALGGRVHEDDDRPEGDESIDNFRREDHPDNDFLSGEEQTSYRNLNSGEKDEEEEIPKRSRMLDKIMRGIHARNGNP